MTWQNDFISWNPDDFCGINRVLVLGETLWKPDLYIYEMTEPDDKSPVIPYYGITNDGIVANAKPVRIVSTCNVEIFKFPFDTQTCNLSFGSYVYTVADIIMLPKSDSFTASQNSISVFVSKGDWTLLDITVRNQSFESDGVAYSQVVYMITVKRAPIVYVINLIIPAGFLVFLDMGSMFIQMGTGERLGFKITVILGFSVLLLILNDMVPNSDSPPVLGVFCVVCLAIMVISIIGSIATSYMLTLSATQPNVPQWIRIWILKHLARVLFFKLKQFQEYGVTAESGDKEIENGRKTEQPNLELRERKRYSQREGNVTLEVKLLKRLLEEILKIHNELKLSRNEDDAKSEWYIAALVVDRLVLILYLLIVIIIFTIVITVWCR